MKKLSEKALSKHEQGLLKEDEIYFERYLETRRLIMECDYNTLMEENYNRGHEDGETKGILKGKAEERRTLAEKMRADGVDEEFIRKYFG